MKKYIQVTVYRYDGIVTYYNTYLATNYADAIKQMEKEHTVDRWVETRIECK